MRPRVLLADDEPSVRVALRKIIEDQGCDVTPVADGGQALQALAKGGYQLVVTDLRMPEADGMQVLRASRERDPSVPVIVLTAYGTVPSAVEAMRLGAANFITKPFEVATVEGVVRDVLALPPAPQRIPTRRKMIDHELVGGTPEIEGIRSLIEQIADSDLTVLITGESGTGKEVVAHLIHERSSRHRGPFIPVNCAAIPGTLLESELFGHVRGAFTGAQERVGRFTQAAGGTLFLDEIAEMSPELQAKVLRVIQDKEVMPVGAQRSHRIDARIVSATNRDLRQLIDEGRFREDLYYRLNVLPVHLPPLRERREDIPALCQYFIDRSCARTRRPPCRLGELMTDAAIEKLMEHHWPGNVRELENVMERILHLRGEQAAIGPAEVPLQPLPQVRPSRAQGRIGRGRTLSGGQEELPDAGVPLPEGGLDLRDLLGNIERRLIHKALLHTGGNRKAAAQMLRLNRTTLVEKLKRLKEADREDRNDLDDE